MLPKNVVDQTITKYGRLKPKECVPRSKWLCVCDCGKEVVVRTCNLTSGNTSSCGCLKDESIGNTKHGMYGTREFNTWQNMITRCTNPNREGYKNYGGRGISVCERWMSFDNFYADMGNKPEGMTLERKDNEGNYEPGNCRWATMEEHAIEENQMLGRKNCLHRTPE